MGSPEDVGIARLYLPWPERRVSRPDPVGTSKATSGLGPFSRFRRGAGSRRGRFRSARAHAATVGGAATRGVRGRGGGDATLDPQGALATGDHRVLGEQAEQAPRLHAVAMKQPPGIDGEPE